MGVKVKGTERQDIFEPKKEAQGEAHWEGAFSLSTLRFLKAARALLQP